jgi:hypothetical protein
MIALQPPVFRSFPVYVSPYNSMRSRDSVVGIATGYGLDDRGSEFESPYDQRFSNLHVVQTGFGAHPIFYSMGMGVKATGRGAEHLPPASAEVKKMWIYTSAPL